MRYIPTIGVDDRAQDIKVNGKTIRLQIFDTVKHLSGMGEYC